MPASPINQVLSQILGGKLRNIANDFIVDRKARSLSPSTIRTYSQELGYFLDWCDQQGVINLNRLDC